jgi:hypothetical protein
MFESSRARAGYRGVQLGDTFVTRRLRWNIDDTRHLQPHFGDVLVVNCICIDNFVSTRRGDAVRDSRRTASLPARSSLAISARK